MKHRTLGKTKLEVSEVGLGAWQLQQGPTWSGMSEADALRIIARALELGCTLFDTAPNYGAGASERLLGKGLGNQRQHVVVVTKFGHGVGGQTDFSKAQLRASLDGSLGRLRSDYVDVLLLHSPPRNVLAGETGLYEELERLQEQGKVRFYGVSLDYSAEIELVLSRSKAQVLEVLFNAFHQEPRRSFLRCANEGVGLIVKVPLDSGWLSGRYGTGALFADIRSRWSSEVVQKRAAFLKQIGFMQMPNATLAQSALSFVLAHSAVGAVIPGCKSLEQLEGNLGASDFEMPKETLERLHSLWEQQFEKDPLPW